MGEQFKRLHCICFTASTILLALVAVSCKGQDFGVLQPTPKDLCQCLPIEPDIADYRHLAKHVAIPNIPAPQDVTVAMILSWTQDPVIPPDAPRSGRETEVFHISNAFLQKTSVNAVDCDVVMEISHTADKSSSRMIVETPVDVNIVVPVKTCKRNSSSMGLASTHSMEANFRRACPSTS
jgi:hypothetical protein